MAEVGTEQPRAVRRKFAMPPVKLACLSCRASRTRCDGGQPCASCVSKHNDCVYRPSRRGGPRIRKKTAPSSPIRPVDEPLPTELSLSVPLIPPPPIEIQNFVDAGAALGQLPDLPPDSDFIFDNLFLNAFPDVTFNDTTLPPAFQPIQPIQEKSGPLVRTYRNNASLLQAYYCWIHLFVPILPAPETSPPVDEPTPVSQNQPEGFSSGLDFSSPVALALSAVLALVPCAQDTDPTSPESVLFRRNCAQFFAQAAIESIEAESEIPGSSTEPEKTLESTPPSVDRAPFHPRVPVELESIVALNLLSIYEYAQRGNLKKMRSRAGQALVEAMMFNLHKQTDEDDFYAEAKRRIWWMTYLQATQTAIVSCTTPPLELFGVSFTTKYPTLEVDPEAWQLLIETQQALLATTSFIVDLNEAITNKLDMEPIYKKIADLESTIAPLVERCDAWPVSGPLAPIVDSAETCLVRSLRCMARTRANSARIKVHRFVAFGDYPVFTGKMCDLQAMSDVSSSAADTADTMSWLPCMCGISGHNGPTKMESPESMASMASLGATATTTGTSTSSCSGTPETVHSIATPATSAHLEACRKAPFSSHWSAKVCLRAALNIANDFDNMPYPNPSGQFGQDLCFLSPTSAIVAPRMLPSYVCCAMQGAYVFLSIYRKTSLISPGAASSGYLVSMLLQLQQGLMSILGAIENYSIAFEAMQAMRDQVRKSAEGLITLES